MKFKRTWIYRTYWRIKLNIRLLLSHRGVDHYLDLRTVDWTLENADWPNWGGRYGCGYHYRCSAFHFFVAGRGLGRTAKEAAVRAVRNLENKSKRMREENKVRTDEALKSEKS